MRSFSDVVGRAVRLDFRLAGRPVRAGAFFAAARVRGAEGEWDAAADAGRLAAPLPRVVAPRERGRERDRLRPRVVEADVGRLGPDAERDGKCEPRPCDMASPAPVVSLRRTRDGERDLSGIMAWSPNVSRPAWRTKDRCGSTERRRCGGSLLMSGSTGGVWHHTNTTGHTHGPQEGGKRRT